MLLRCESREQPMSQMGHIRQIDPLPTLLLSLEPRRTTVKSQFTRTENVPIT
jgi:hypothetical protein